MHWTVYWGYWFALSQRRNDPFRARRMDAFYRTISYQLLTKLYMESNPALRFCPPPGPLSFTRDSRRWHLSVAKRDCKMDTLAPGDKVCSIVGWAMPPGRLSGCSCALSTHPTECLHHNSPCVTSGKVLENSETRVLAEIWNPFQLLHRKKIRHRTTKPTVLRNLWRLWLTLISWKISFFFFSTFYFIKTFCLSNPKLLENTVQWVGSNN